MKNIKYLIITAFMFVTPLVSIHAQTLTKGDVIAVAPQLVQVLGNLNSAITVKVNQFNNQDAALNGIVSTMGSVVNTVVDLKGQNLSTNDQVVVNSVVNALSFQLGSLSNIVGNIANQRNNFNQVLGGTVNVLGGISNVIGSAV